MDSVVCLLTLIHWIAIYPVDSSIQPLNNRGQIIKIKEYLLIYANFTFSGSTHITNTVKKFKNIQLRKL